jgi:nucleoside-diphosphate-sugar epimerase
MSVLDAALLIHRIASTGKELKLKYIKMEEIFGQYKDIMRRRPDLTKAHNILGYRAKVTMEEAVRKIVDCRKREIENGGCK